MGRHKLNVSGTIFEFDAQILPHGSKLEDMCKQKSSTDDDTPVFVDRPAKNFSAILAFYQTGELHIPQDVCPGSFRRELDFWNIDYNMLTECCSYRLNSFLNESETRRKFLKETESTTRRGATPGSCNREYLKWRIWSVMDYQENTILAKVYFILMSSVILLSILSLAASTLDSMRRPMTKCEVLEYLHHSEHEHSQKIQQQYNHLDCYHHRFSIDEYDYINDMFDDGVISFDDENGSNNTVKLGNMTVPIKVFVYLDITMLIIFTADILVRVIACPSIRNNFLTVVNIVDTVAILSSYVYVVILHVEREHRYLHSWIHALNYLQVFRSLRFLRVLRKVKASQVLAYTLKKNLKDITVLLLFLFFCVSTFASIFYFTETREVIGSIPSAWYLSIITLTTVGYGDILPESTSGLVVASVCAVTGIILLAITVPIFVNNFLTLYQYSVINDFAYRRQILKNQRNSNDTDIVAKVHLEQND